MKLAEFMFFTTEVMLSCVVVIILFVCDRVLAYTMEGCAKS